MSERGLVVFAENDEALEERVRTLNELRNLNASLSTQNDLRRIRLSVCAVLTALGVLGLTRICAMLTDHGLIKW
jgi:hypothetical protein